MIANNHTIPADRQYVTFHVRDLVLGLPIDHVQEIHRHLSITPVPHTPDSIRGLINLRGDVITIIDLPATIGLEPAEVTPHSHNVVIQQERESIGLLVDGIADILCIPSARITPLPANLHGVDCRFFTGIHTTETAIILVLDLDEVVADSERHLDEAITVGGGRRKQ